VITNLKLLRGPHHEHRPTTLKESYEVVNVL